MAGKLIAANLHFDKAGSTRIESSNNNISLVVGGNKTIMNVTADGVSHTPPDPYTIAFALNTGNIIVETSLNTGTNIRVRSLVNVAGSGVGIFTGNVNVSGSVNSANILVNGTQYHKAGAWVRLAANTITAGSNVKIRNIGPEYKHLRLTLLGLVPATTNTYPIIKFSADNGVTNNSSGYIGFHHRHSAGGTPGANVRASLATAIELHGAEASFSGFQANSSTREGHCAEFLIGSFGQAQKTKFYGTGIFQALAGSTEADSVQQYTTHIMHDYQIINDAIDIYYSSSSTFTGEVFLDGLLA